MEILTREAIEQFKKGGFVGENVISDLEDTALALYDENEKMKAGIEKLREKWKSVSKVETKLLLAIEDPSNINEPVSVGTRARKWAADDFVSDLSALCGKEEK